MADFPVEPGPKIHIIENCTPVYTDRPPKSASTSDSPFKLQLPPSTNASGKPNCVDQKPFLPNRQARPRDAQLPNQRPQAFRNGSPRMNKNTPPPQTQNWKNPVLLTKICPVRGNRQNQPLDAQLQNKRPFPVLLPKPGGTYPAQTSTAIDFCTTPLTKDHNLQPAATS